MLLLSVFLSSGVTSFFGPEHNGGITEKLTKPAHPDGKKPHIMLVQLLEKHFFSLTPCHRLSDACCINQGTVVPGGGLKGVCLR